MNKKEFLNELEECLYDYEIRRDVIEDILSDHEALIDEAIERGSTEEEIIDRLGRPRTIARSLKGEKKKSGAGYKITAVSPFIATILFFILGFQLNFWHPGWLVFLIIPVAGILESSRRMALAELLVALSPFVSAAVFFTIGFMYNVYHPTWLVFFLIPLLGVFNGNKKDKLVGIVIFGLVPLLYLYLEIINYSEYNWVVFLVVVIYGLVTGHIDGVIKIDLGNLGDNEEAKRDERLLKASVLVIGVAYIILGVSFNLWHPGWLLFLIIPVVAMIFVNKHHSSEIPFVAFTPFISVALFILLGDYIGYEYSWLFFMMIPIAGIFTTED